MIGDAWSLPPEVVENSRAIAASALATRGADFQQEVGIAQGEMARRGMLISGMWVSKLGAMCERELTTRAAIIWDALTRAGSSAARVKYDLLVGAFADEARSQIESQATLIRAVFRQLVGPVLNADAYAAAFSGHVDRVVAEYRAKASIFVDNGGYMPEPTQGPPGSANVIIHGDNYGPIQSGADSHATVHVSLGHDQRAAVLHALEAFDQGLDALNVTGYEPNPEAIGAAASIRAELAAPQPNRLTIGALLSAIGSTIQTVGAMAPAYAAIKLAAALFGFTLP